MKPGARLAAALAMIAALSSNGASAAPGTSTDLELRRVLLSSGSVGYFEYEATLQGESDLRLSVRRDRVDDVLKSLVISDGTGTLGQVSSRERTSRATLCAITRSPRPPSTLRQSCSRPSAAPTSRWSPVVTSSSVGSSPSPRSRPGNLPPRRSLSTASPSSRRGLCTRSSSRTWRASLLVEVRAPARRLRLSRHLTLRT